MRIVFFGNASIKIAAIRYRVIKFAAMLEQDGHRCVVCLPSSVQLHELLYEDRPKWSKLLYLLIVAMRRMLQIWHVIGADVVLFRGSVFPYGPPIIERLIRLLNPRMVFDIDDAIWERPAHVSSSFVRFMDHGWVAKMSRMCAHAIVGNDYLAGYVRKYNPNITVIPTCIDMEKHVMKEYGGGNAQGPVVLGWTGLRYNLGYMEIIERELQALAAKYDIVLSVATAREYHLDGVTVENQYWVNEREIDYLRGADIGLMPLKDTPRARGKCAFKALQYMAVGVPPVLSPVGMNVEIVEDGTNGFLADSPSEWREKLERLIAEPELRRSMGMAARETVRRQYSHEANYPKLKKIIETVAALRRSRGQSVSKPPDP